MPDFAKVNSWHSCEVNGLILVWFHCDGEDPQWTVPEQQEITNGEWVYRGRTEHFVNCHIQVSACHHMYAACWSVPICEVRLLYVPRNRNSLVNACISKCIMSHKRCLCDFKGDSWKCCRHRSPGAPAQTRHPQRSGPTLHEQQDLGVCAARMEGSTFLQTSYVQNTRSEEISVKQYYNPLFQTNHSMFEHHMSAELIIDKEYFHA